MNNIKFTISIYLFALLIFLCAGDILFSKDAETKKQCLIIWYHNIASTDPNVLSVALNNPHITHVILKHLYFLDAPLEGKIKKKVLKAVNICKSNNVEIIWSRPLWPLYNIDDFVYSDFFDTQYYIRCLNNIKSESKILDVNLVALDAEAYGYFPFKDKFKKQWNIQELKKIKFAIKSAIEITGKADFIIPSYGAFENHIYNVLVDLGELKIAGHTLYDIPKKLNDPRRPYDIFTAYLNITKDNIEKPYALYFTPEEIFNRKELWINKKGLVLYPYEKNKMPVSIMISSINMLDMSIRKGN